MGTRKRINISVDVELYEKLQRIKDAYGFKNVCEFNVALLNTLCTYIDAAEHRTSRKADVNADLITDMFNDYGAWARTPDGTTPVRHNNMKKDGKG